MKSTFRDVLQQAISEFKKDSSDPFRMSLAVGLGLAFGVSPLWGFQMLAAYAVATLIKANRVIVLASTYVSIPPTIPFIIYFSFKIGSYVVPEEYRAENSSITDIESIGSNIIQYLTGAFIFSLCLGGIGILITYGVIVMMRKLKKNRKDEME